MNKAAFFSTPFSKSKLCYSVIFFIIIGITQCLVGMEKSVSFEQHVQVQQELSSLIANYVKQNLPGMTNFEMHSIYTKPPKKGFLKAYFDYSFMAPVGENAEQAITELQGTALLKKIKETPNQEWALEKVEIEGESLAFEDPIMVTAPKNESGSAQPLLTSPAPVSTVSPTMKVETPSEVNQ